MRNEIKKRERSGYRVEAIKREQGTARETTPTRHTSRNVPKMLVKRTRIHTCITRMFGMHDGERSTREIRGKAYRGNEFLLALGSPRQDRATDRPVQGKHAQKEKKKEKKKNNLSRS